MKIFVNDQPLRSQTPTLTPPHSASTRTLLQRLSTTLMLITDDHEEMARHFLGCVHGGTFSLERPTDEQAACAGSMSYLAWQLLDLAAKEQGDEGIGVVVLEGDVEIAPAILDGISVLEQLHTLIVPLTCEITEELRQAVSESCPSIARLQYGARPDDEVTLHVGAVEFAVRARSACETLTQVLADPASEDGSAAIGQALNSLIDLSPHFAAGHVDKVLVGFLNDCIMNHRTRFLQEFVNTIVAARPGKLDTERMMGVLSGQATPVAVVDWQPEAATALPSIVNLQGAQLAANQYRGMPPLLHRLLIRSRRMDRAAAATMARTEPPQAQVHPVLASDRRMYQGIKDVLEAVLNAGGMSRAEKTAIWLSAYAAAQWQGEEHVVCEITIAQTAMQKGHHGAVAAVIEALVRSELEWSAKWHLIGLQKVNLQEVANALGEVSRLLHHGWFRDMHAFIKPLARWQALLAAGGRATVGAQDSELSTHCATANLQTAGMKPDEDGLKTICWSLSEISGLSTYHLEAAPEGAPSKGEGAQWYVIPWRLVMPRART